MGSPKWEYTDDLVPRKCPDLVDRKLTRSLRYPGCKDMELVSEMQTCEGRMCVSYCLDVSGEPLCRKYGSPIFVMSLEALARKLDEEDAKDA